MIPWSGRSRRVLLAALAWTAGAGLIAVLILNQDMDNLSRALRTAGWWFPVFLLTFAATLALDSQGWRVVIPSEPPVALPALMVRRWIGISVNTLLPVAQLGGEVVRAHLLRTWGLAGPIAAASVIVDLTIGLLTQVLLALLALLLLSSLLGSGEGLAGLWLGVALFGLLIAAFFCLQRQGLIRHLGGLVDRLFKGTGWRQVVDDAAALDREVQRTYRQKRRLVACFFWRLLGWLWPAFELWLLFWLLGLPISLAEAVALEMVGQIVRSAGFGIPGGLGVQEGGVVLAAGWLALPPELALAAMLVRRLRDVATSLTGLAGWFVIERRHRWQAGDAVS